MLESGTAAPASACSSVQKPLPECAPGPCLLTTVSWGRGLRWRPEEAVSCCDVGPVVGHGSLLISMGSHDGLAWRDSPPRPCLEVEGKSRHLQGGRQPSPGDLFLLNQSLPVANVCVRMWGVEGRALTWGRQCTRQAHTRPHPGALSTGLIFLCLWTVHLPHGIVVRLKIGRAHV